MRCFKGLPPCNTHCVLPYPHLCILLLCCPQGADEGKSAKQEKDELIMALLLEEVLPKATSLYLAGPLQVLGKAAPGALLCQTWRALGTTAGTAAQFPQQCPNQKGCSSSGGGRGGGSSSRTVRQTATAVPHLEPDLCCAML
jgi:hypothetical protein